MIAEPIASGFPVKHITVHGSHRQTHEARNEENKRRAKYERKYTNYRQFRRIATKGNTVSFSEFKREEEAQFFPLLVTTIDHFHIIQFIRV